MFPNSWAQEFSLRNGRMSKPLRGWNEREGFARTGWLRRIPILFRIFAGQWHARPGKPAIALRQSAGAIHSGTDFRAGGKRTFVAPVRYLCRIAPPQAYSHNCFPLIHKCRRSSKKACLGSLSNAFSIMRIIVSANPSTPIVDKTGNLRQ